MYVFSMSSLRITVSYFKCGKDFVLLELRMDLIFLAPNASSTHSIEMVSIKVMLLFFLHVEAINE